MQNRDEYYLNQNLIFVSHSIANIEERMKQVEIVNNFRIGSSRTGYPILFRNDVALNNQYDPVEECVNVFESVPQSKFNLYIICGLELGHLLSFFSDNSKAHIILFENDLELMKYTFSKVSLIKVLGNPKVHVVSDYDELAKTMKHIKTLDTINKTYVVSNEFYSNAYGHVKALLQESYL